MAVTKARLVKAAENLNKVLGLEPAIDVKADKDTLAADILEAAELLVPEDDISEATLKVIADLETARDVGELDADAETTVTTNTTTEDDLETAEDTSDKETAEETEKTPTNDKVPAKKAKAKSVPKAKETKKKHKTTPLGSRVGTQAEKMDLIMLNADGPLTVEELSEKSGFTKGRVKIHLNYLMKKGVLKEKDGRYYPQPKK
jgi:Fic family protein